MIIYLMRHCETYIKGKNKLLSKKGIETAGLIAKKIKKFDIKRIYVSSLKRALDTAQIINNQLKVEIYIDGRIKERSHGRYINLKGETNMTFVDDYDERENIDKFVIRINSFKKSILKNCKDDKILVISHGGALKLLMMLLDISPIEFREGQILKIEV